MNRPVPPPKKANVTAWDIACAPGIAPPKRLDPKRLEEALMGNVLSRPPSHEDRYSDKKSRCGWFFWGDAGMVSVDRDRVWVFGARQYIKTVPAEIVREVLEQRIEDGEIDDTSKRGRKDAKEYIEAELLSSLPCRTKDAMVIWLRDRHQVLVVGGGQDLARWASETLARTIRDLTQHDAPLWAVEHDWHRRLALHRPAADLADLPSVLGWLLKEAREPKRLVRTPHGSSVASGWWTVAIEDEFAVTPEDGGKMQMKGHIAQHAIDLATKLADPDEPKGKIDRLIESSAPRRVLVSMEAFEGTRVFGEGLVAIEATGTMKAQLPGGGSYAPPEDHTDPEVWSSWAGLYATGILALWDGVMAILDAYNAGPVEREIGPEGEVPQLFPGGSSGVFRWDEDAGRPPDVNPDQLDLFTDDDAVGAPMLALPPEAGDEPDEKPKKSTRTRKRGASSLSGEKRGRHSMMTPDASPSAMPPDEMPDPAPAPSKKPRRRKS